MSILDRISKLRKENGNISINRLEKEAGLTRGSMSKWDDHAPSHDKLRKVADYFGVSIDYLLTGSEQKEKPPTEVGGKNADLIKQINEELPKMSRGQLEAFLKLIMPREGE